MTAIDRAPQDHALARAYDRAAAGWHDTIARLGYPGAYAALFSAHPPPPGAGHVLDAGTGSGAFAAAFLATSGPSRALTLLDPSAPMLADAAERLRGSGPVPTLVSGGVGTPALDGVRFDIVLCGHVVEHLDDPEAGLRWLAGRLRPGGTFYLAASRPHWCTALLRWKWGHKAYRPDRMLALLDRVGLRARHFAFPAGPPSRTSAGYVATKP